MCPRCKSTDIGWSRRRKLADFFMAIWRMKPYRCRECQSRFYLPSRLDIKIAAELAWRHDVENGQHSKHVRDSGRDREHGGPSPDVGPASSRKL